MTYRQFAAVLGVLAAIEVVVALIGGGWWNWLMAGFFGLFGLGLWRSSRRR